MLIYIYPKYSTKEGKVLNTNLLKSEFIKNGFTQKKVAGKIGISENSLSRKLAGKRDFTLTEVNKLISLLNLSDEKNIHDIFFEL